MIQGRSAQVDGCGLTGHKGEVWRGAGHNARHPCGWRGACGITYAADVPGSDIAGIHDGRAGRGKQQVAGAHVLGKDEIRVGEFAKVVRAAVAIVIVKDGNSVEHIPAGKNGPVRGAVIVAVDVIVVCRGGCRLHQEESVADVFLIAVISIDGLPRICVDGKAITSSQQDKESIAAQRQATEIGELIDVSRIVVIAFDIDEVGSRLDDSVGCPSQFNVFVGRVATGGVEQNFVQQQFRRIDVIVVFGDSHVDARQPG